MTRLLGVLLVLAAWFAPFRAEARSSVTVILQPLRPQEADGDAIRKLIDDSTAAWNAGDVAGYAARISSDATFTGVTGVSGLGPEAFKSCHDELLTTIYKGSRLKQVLKQVRFVAKEVAIADIDTELTGYMGLPQGVRARPDGVLRTRLQMVLVKIGNTWWIVGHHEVPKVPELQG